MYYNFNHLTRRLTKLSINFAEDAQIDTALSTNLGSNTATIMQANFKGNNGKSLEQTVKENKKMTLKDFWQKFIKSPFPKILIALAGISVAVVAGLKLFPIAKDKIEEWDDKRAERDMQVERDAIDMEYELKLLEMFPDAKNEIGDLVINRPNDFTEIKNIMNSTSSSDMQQALDNQIIKDILYNENTPLRQVFKKTTRMDTNSSSGLKMDTFVLTTTEGAKYLQDWLNSLIFDIQENITKCSANLNGTPALQNMLKFDLQRLNAYIEAGVITENEIPQIPDELLAKLQ